MIGVITLPSQEKIILTDDGEIKAARTGLQSYGEMKLSRYRRTYSPADGSFGVGFLHELAKELGGEVVLEEKEGPPPGAIY